MICSRVFETKSVTFPGAFTFSDRNQGRDEFFTRGIDENVGISGRGQLEASRVEASEHQAGPAEELCLSSLDPQQVRGRSGIGEKSPEPCFSHKDNAHWPANLENEARRRK